MHHDTTTIIYAHEYKNLDGTKNDDVMKLDPIFMKINICIRVTVQCKHLKRKSYLITHARA